MNNIKGVNKVLGVAFLFQFITSLLSGTVLRQQLIVSGIIGESLLKIASKPAC